MSAETSLRWLAAIRERVRDRLWQSKQTSLLPVTPNRQDEEAPRPVLLPTVESTVKNLLKLSPTGNPIHKLVGPCSKSSTKKFADLPALSKAAIT